ARYFGRRAKLRPELVYLAIDRDSIQLDQFDDTEIQASPALSLMKQGWPWPRPVYALIMDKLIASGAKVVVMDLMFPTPREGDEAFHEALDKYRDHVVIGSNFVQATRKGDTSTLQLPSEDLIQSASPLDSRVGYVNFWPDRDEVIRRAYYGRTMSDIFGDRPEAGEETLYSLAAGALKKSGNGSAVPLTGAHRLRFAGPPGTFKPKSVCDIFDAKKWATPEYDGGKFFKDKIVLLGPEGDFLKDIVRTPFGAMPGPELHLNAINAALQGDFVTENPENSVYLYIVLAGVIAWLICVEFPSPLLRLALIGGVVVIWLVVAQILYNPAALYIFALNPLVTLCTSGVFSLSWDFFVERREKARIRGKFERYVSKQIVKEIIDNPASYFNTLGGVRKPIAVLFSDLRGFTSMTEEATDSHALVAQLNEYFDVMVEPIIANNGCLDKFIGDAIMAVWGNIQSRGPVQDVRDSVTAALRMRDSLPALNEQWVASGKKALKVGIGINYGEAIVGDLGSKKHQMNFTAIGDIVNLASRIEGVTKEYAIDLLVAEDAANLVGEFFHMQVAGLVQVKGRKKPVKLYYVIGERAGEPDRKLVEYMRLYDEGMALYMKGAFADAGSQFRQALMLHPPDKLAQVYIERCAELEKEPVPQGWDGVFVMTKK
ncbi:MAG: adenylate/guanylate cyclase domain-containing protein, partial [Chthoniobacteraceae bacterium]